VTDLPPPPGSVPPPPPYPSPPPVPPGYQAYPPQYGGHTPYQQYGGERAGFGARFGGWLLDGLLGLVAFIPGIVLIIVSVAAGHDAICTRSGFSREDRFYQCREPNAGLLVLGILLLAAGYFGYIAFLVIRLGRTGQTPGRKAVGIKVVDKNTGQPIGGGKALGRYAFAIFISGQVCWLGYLWMLWDADKQTWHDKVVNSIVVRT
jgi:uncharacterized RDD family membrane protein YckC